MSQYNTAVLSLVDASQIPLHLEAEGSYSGTKTFQMRLGPWEFDTIAELTTDYVGAHEASAFLNFCGDVWGYMVADQMGHRLRMVIFDGGVAKMKQDKARTGNIDTTLAKLKPTIKAAFEYKKPNWHPIPHADLVP